MTTKTPQTTGQNQDQTFINFASQSMQASSKVHFNLAQEIIMTTDDKIRLCLIEHLSRMEKRNSWVAPLGILLTILIIFPTTTFKEFLVSADTWQALFIFVGVISVIWLIKALWEARVSSSLNDVVKSIKESSITQSLE